MIDLKKWCAKQGSKTHLFTPSSHSGKTVASNGQIMICVDERPGYPPSHWRVISVLEQLSKITGEFVTLDREQESPKRVQCQLCSGTGEKKQLDCLECNGEGIVELDNSYNQYEAECKSCNGSGIAQESGPCHYCETTGEHYPEQQPIYVDGIPIQPKYYDLLKSLPADTEVQANYEKDWIIFRNNESFGAIMSYAPVKREG